MEVKYIFIDIDGTLFDHDAGCVPESAIQAIHKAHENGHRIFLCTGRGLTEVGKDFDFLPLDGRILSCGANIIVENKTLFLATFPQQELKDCVHFMREHHIGFSLDGSTKSFLDKEAYTMFQNIALQRANLYHFSKMQEEDYKTILKISLFSKYKDACERLIQSLPSSLTGFLRTESSPLTHGEISIKGVNKASGIQHVLDYYHADRSNSIAIGDSMNDLEMMDYAGLSICMGNGDDIVKKSSDFVTKSINEDGLAYAFSVFDLI